MASTSSQVGSVRSRISRELLEGAHDVDPLVPRRGADHREDGRVHRVGMRGGELAERGRPFGDQRAAVEEPSRVEEAA